MARQHYTFAGDLPHHSQIGNAIIALVPKLGSNKRVTLYDARVFHKGWIGSGSPGVFNLSAIRRATAAPTQGTPAPVFAFDTGTTLPSGVSVTTDGPAPATSSDTLGKHATSVYSTIVANGSYTPFGTKYGASGFGGRMTRAARVRDGATQRATLNEGQAFYITRNDLLGSISTDYATTPNRAIIVTFRVSGKSYSSVIETTNTGQGTYLAAIHNATGSGVTVELVSVNLEDGSAVNTPTFQLVPMGPVFDGYLSDSLRVINGRLTRHDTATPDLDSGLVTVYQDVAFAPFGLPIAAFQAWVVSVYSGFNYLNANDFNGPIYSKYFAEGRLSGAAAPVACEIMLTYSMGMPLLMKGQRIVCHPGEGVAIVKTAESVNISSYLPDGDGGARHYAVSLSFYVEDDSTPTLGISGHLSGSDVLVLDAGTTTVLFDAQDADGQPLGWQYDYSPGMSVDVVAYKAGYKPFALRNFALQPSGGTIPISQTADPYYLA